MAAALSIAGEKFGRLTAIDRVGADRHGKAIWSFLCECGRVTSATASQVKMGSTQSCGCLGNEARAGRAALAGQARGVQMRTHGMAGKRPEYGVWKTMRQRCANPRSADYPAYGGRGIQVCDRWGDFGLFLADMGPRPSDRHSIDRKNTNGNYEPGNCRWADDFEQANNRRSRGTGEYATMKEIQK